MFALSSWLGKVWANRLMEADRARFAREHEQLRAALDLENQRTLNALRQETDIYREKHLKAHQDKINIYRLTADIVADLLAEVSTAVIKSAASGGMPVPLPPDVWERFTKGRIRMYGYLAMLAPQEVMDSSDLLMDHLISTCEGREVYDWRKIRSLAIAMLNTVRKDIGIDVTPIDYRGKL